MWRCGVSAGDCAGGLTDVHYLVNGLGGSAGFGENVLAVGDDNSSSAINITAVFGAQGLNFFGYDYTSIYINNNGNITFPVPYFTPSELQPAQHSDHRSVLGRCGYARRGGYRHRGKLNRLESVYYDLDGTNGVFTVTWDDVGYYGSHQDKLDAFQLQLVSRGTGNFDIGFRYQTIDWTTGDANGGSGGLAGPGGSRRAPVLPPATASIFRAAAMAIRPRCLPFVCDRQHRRHRRRRVPGDQRRKFFDDF